MYVSIPEFILGNFLAWWDGLLMYASQYIYTLQFAKEKIYINKSLLLYFWEAYFL